MNRGTTTCPHCLQRVSSLNQHTRDTGDADLRQGVCPTLHALRNTNNSNT